MRLVRLNGIGGNRDEEDPPSSSGTEDLGWIFGGPLNGVFPVVLPHGILSLVASGLR